MITFRNREMTVLYYNDRPIISKGSNNNNTENDDVGGKINFSPKVSYHLRFIFSCLLLCKGWWRTWVEIVHLKYARKIALHFLCTRDVALVKDQVYKFHANIFDRTDQGWRACGPRWNYLRLSVT